MVLDEEKLIHLISQYLELYDQQHEHYMNITRKNNIWKGIAKEMGEKEAVRCSFPGKTVIVWFHQPKNVSSNNQIIYLKDVLTKVIFQATVCKEKWKTLRDGYHRSIKRRKEKMSRDGTTKSKKWRFENQMEFLQPYLQERATKSNIEEVSIKSASPDDNNDTNESYIFNIMPTSPELEPLNSSQSSRPSSSAASPMFTNIADARKKKQTELSQLTSVANVLQTYLDSRPVRTTPPIDTGNPMHSFFKAMADSVIALPPYEQLKIKNKIYAIVSDAEYKNLTVNSTSFTEPPVTAINKTSHLHFCNCLKPISTPRAQPLNIQDQQVQNNVQDQIDGIINAETNNGIPGRTNNDANIVIDFNDSPDINYVLSKDGILVPRKLTMK